MTDSSSGSKVSLYEKFRSFTSKHLAPINTLLLLGATFGGGQLLDQLGLLPIGRSNHVQSAAPQPEPTPSLTPGVAAVPLPVEAKMPATPLHQSEPMTARSVRPLVTTQADNDTLQMLSKQLDDERLKHANAILDANLK